MASVAKVEEAPPAVMTVDRLLRRAQEAGASDLHLDPSEDGLRVRLRLDGVLVPQETVPRAVAARVVGRLKALADLLVYRSDLPQEGRIAAARSPAGVELRVATYPTLLGERVALRFDTAQGGGRPLEGLGLPDAALAGLARAIDQPDGVILLTGPSGSGKTTTLYSCLRHLVAGSRARAIVTIEDPIERRIPGVTQTEIDPAAGLTFDRALRSILRQDPEVILVGEVRDRETARIALEAGLTGHLVASTVHAGTAPFVFARLLEMGIEPFVLTTAVRGVLAQRLLRRCCGACGGKGCPRCRGSGFHGRVVVAEWLPMSAPLRRAVLGRGDGEEVAAAAREAGYDPLAAAARTLVGAGITTREEVDRVLGLA